MIFEQELKDKGFEIIGGRLYYDFSDFETLWANVSDWDCADGSKAIAISNLTLADHVNAITHISINYTLYFRDINKFYELLTLLGYKIR